MSIVTKVAQGAVNKAQSVITSGVSKWQNWSNKNEQEKKQVDSVAGKGGFDDYVTALESGETKISDLIASTANKAVNGTKTLINKASTGFDSMTDKLSDAVGEVSYNTGKNLNSDNHAKKTLGDTVYKDGNSTGEGVEELSSEWEPDYLKTEESSKVKTTTSETKAPETKVPEINNNDSHLSKIADAKALLDKLGITGATKDNDKELNF